LPGAKEEKKDDLVVEIEDSDTVTAFWKPSDQSPLFNEKTLKGTTY
jgi:hypothetical protein